MIAHWSFEARGSPPAALDLLKEVLTVGSLKKLVARICQLVEAAKKRLLYLFVVKKTAPCGKILGCIVDNLIVPVSSWIIMKEMLELRVVRVVLKSVQNQGGVDCIDRLNASSFVWHKSIVWSFIA